MTRYYFDEAVLNGGDRHGVKADWWGRGRGRRVGVVFVVVEGVAVGRFNGGRKG